ncbi:AraC family transcriptional regulator [Cohnella sp. CFH 77786]|uniref:AraC family transcriptional regulator n=1 Tax=Cohnella sp. CFH 77786 TaxID=2662265 RepID=UPI001C60A24F
MPKTVLPAGTENVIENRTMPDADFAFRLFGVHLRKVDARWSYPEHEHSLYEINWVTEGAQRIKAAGKVWTQRLGDLVWVQPGVRHESMGSADGAAMEYFCLHFEVGDLGLRKKLNGLGSALYRADSELVRALKPVLDRFVRNAREGSGDESRTDTLMTGFELFARLLGYAHGNATDATDAAGPGAADPVAARLAAAIERLVRQDAGADDKRGLVALAKEMGYTPASCTRIFRHVFGISPRQYLTSLKQRRAKELLLDRSLTVEQVSEALGYRDVSQFSKQFKRWLGLSPSAYRQLSHEQ